MGEDAFSAIAERIVAADSTFDGIRVAAAVREVVRNEPRALRLLATMDAAPGMTTSGLPSMPRALQRIITSLAAEQSTVLRLPVCPECEVETPEPMIVVDGRPLCAGCAHRAKLRYRECVECTKRVQHTRQAAGQDYCPICWRALVPKRVELLVTAIAASGVTVSADTARPLLEAAEASSTNQLKLVLDCLWNGRERFQDPTTGSPAFARFYRALAADVPGLRPLVCSRCKEDRPLTNVHDGHRVCQRCYAAARTIECSGCRKIRGVALRLPDGSGLCQACRKSLPDAMAICTVCAEQRKIARRGTDGPICGPCRLRGAVDTCRTCGRTAPCRFAGTARAVCEICRRRCHPCVRCGRSRIVSTRDDTGAPICHSCADRSVERCVSCGNHSRVVGRIDGEALCDACYRKHPVGFRDCARCGSHRRIRRSGLCDYCTISDLCDELFPAQLVTANPALRSLRDALLHGSAQRTVAAFLRPKSIRLLRTILREPSAITHDAIDELGSEQTTYVIRSALVEHGLLEPIDFHMRRLEQWIDQASETITDPIVRAGFVQYATWKHLRELRATTVPVSGSTASSRRRELKIVLDLIGWAHRREIPLSELQQGHVDEWSMTGKERHRANGFLRWAYRNKLVRHLQLTPQRSVEPLLNGLADEERAELFAAVLGDADIAPGTKLAAALILLYGIRPHRIVHIELSQLGSRDGMATIRIGEESLHLPEELNLVASAVSAARSAHRLLHSVEDTRWLFPGTRPGYPLSSTTLLRRLSKIGFPTTAARKGAILALASDVHPVVLAHLTGIHIRTAIWWRDAMATSRARYVDQLLADSGSA